MRIKEPSNLVSSNRGQYDMQELKDKNLSKNNAQEEAKDSLDDAEITVIMPKTGQTSNSIGKENLNLPPQAPPAPVKPKKKKRKRERVKVKVVIEEDQSMNISGQNPHPKEILSKEQNSKNKGEISQPKRQDQQEFENFNLILKTKDLEE